MSDTVKSWIEERREARMCRGTNYTDAYKNLPRALNALEQVLELIEFMETDAENYLNAGHRDASDVLLEAAGDLRQAIVGAINERPGQPAEQNRGNRKRRA